MLNTRLRKELSKITSASIASAFNSKKAPSIHFFSAFCHLTTTVKSFWYGSIALVMASTSGYSVRSHLNRSSSYKRYEYQSYIIILLLRLGINPTGLVQVDLWDSLANEANENKEEKTSSDCDPGPDWAACAIFFAHQLVWTERKDSNAEIY